MEQLAAVLEELRALREDVRQLRADRPAPKPEYSVEEAAPRLKLKPYTVRQLCNMQQVRCRKRGRRWFIPHDELERLEREGAPVGKRLPPSERRRP